MQKNTRAAMLAVTLGSMSIAGFKAGSVTPKMHSYVPTMVTASPEEIAAWNADVEAKKPAKPSKVHRRVRGDNGQHPKFPKARARKQHKHPLRDEHGAYTLIGRPYELENVHPASHEVVLTGWVDGDQFGYTVQRKWLAGISAQRGY